MIITVKALELGEVAADLVGRGLFLGEEGRVAVTMSDSDGQMAVAVLTSEEADTLGRTLLQESSRARRLALRTRLQDIFRLNRPRTTVLALNEEKE